MAPLISRAACVLVAAVLLFSAFDADAKRRRRKKNRHKPPTVALFIVTKGKVSKKLIKKVRRELRKSGGKIGAAKVLEGKKLKRKLRKKPEVLITKCGSSMKCIAKLGKKAEAKEVLYGRASIGEDGTVTIQFVSIGVKSREIERKIMVEIASAKQAKQVIVAQSYELFGVEKPADVPPDEDTAALLASLESDPTADLDEGNGGAVVEELALEDFLEIPPMLEELPGAESGTEFASLDLPIEPTDDEGSEGIAASDDVVAVIAPPAEIGSTQPTASGGMGVLGYGGLALAGVGAAAAGTGAYFGYSAGAKRDSIKYGAGGTLQSRALELEGEANDAAGRANLLFAVAAALIGGALVVVDMLTGDAPPEANVIVGVEPGGASLAWRVVW